jgi:hypothetical protein
MMAKTAEKKITKFDIPILKQLDADLIAMITAFAAARGIEVKAIVKEGKYSPMTSTTGLTLQFAIAGSAGRAAEAETRKQQEGAAARAEYIKSAASLGLKPEWLGKTFWADGGARGGNVYTIVGLDSSNAKFPVMVEKHRNGKLYGTSLMRLRHVWMRWTRLTPRSPLRKLRRLRK